MIDERYIELMNGEIDGANSPEESDELKRYLESSPEAQSYFEGLRQLEHIFEEAKNKLPPEQVRQNILSSIYGKKQVPEKKAFFAATFSFFKNRPSRTFVYAFAGGIIFGLCLWAIILQFIPQATSPDLDKLYGTLAIMEDEKSLFTSQPIVFKLSEVSGSVRIRYAKEKIFTELRLLSYSEIQIVFKHDHHVQFEGLSVAGSGHYQTTIKDSETSLTHNGTRDYLLMFDDRHHTMSAIHFRIFADGEQIFEETVHPR